MTRGTIVRIMPQGYGFIEADETQYFFHAKAVEGGEFDGLREGQPAMFEAEHGSPRPRASLVVVK